MCLVSVCVPVYNGERYLRESLDSIINQSYKDLDILVVNDCSTDNSTTIINEYQAVDSRIRLIHNMQNLGLVGNWNRCISEASGSYIKLHFQDDMMCDDTIEKMMALAVSENVDVVLTEREYIFEHDVKFSLTRLARLSDRFDEITIIEPEFMAALIMYFGIDKNFMGEPILGLVKKEVFTEYGFYDDTFKQIGDFEFWIRLGLNQKLGFIPEKLHSFRLHNDSQSTKNSREPEINPTHIDRIHLASKMKHHQFYEKFREIVGSTFTENLLQDYVISYTKSYGYEKLAKYIDESYFEYLAPEESHWKRLLKVISTK